MITIYHNPRCSKSRETLTLLKERNLEPQVVLYMEHPMSATTLRGLLKKLACSARDLIRTGEPLYRELQLRDPSLTEAQLLEVMTAHPILIERPIVVNGERAIVGRPPHNVLAIL